MEIDIILFYAGQYSVPDLQTGEVSRGTSISYYVTTNLDPVHNPDGTKGLRASKSNSDFYLMAKIPQAPAHYKATMGMKVGSDGKPTLTIIDLEYQSDVVLDFYATEDGKPGQKAAASAGK